MRASEGRTICTIDLSYLETLGERSPLPPKNLMLVLYSRFPMTDPDLDLLRGTLDLLILKTLSWGPMHGLAVLRWVEQVTGSRLQITEGALYPALHRMEQKGWLGADWGYSDRNREAKFYKLTAAGRRQLVAELSKWSRYTEAVNLVITAEGAK
jgi:PadR family transcriptional regulator, regulatory protein PadR